MNNRKINWADWANWAEWAEWAKLVPVLNSIKSTINTLGKLLHYVLFLWSIFLTLLFILSLSFSTLSAFQLILFTSLFKMLLKSSIGRSTRNNMGLSIFGTKLIFSAFKRLMTLFAALSGQKTLLPSEWYSLINGMSRVLIHSSKYTNHWFPERKVQKNARHTFSRKKCEDE